MRRAFVVLMSGVALVMVFAVGDRTQAQKARPDVYLEDEDAVRNCNHINVNYSGRQAYRDEERHSIRGSVSLVTVRPSENGGAHVYGAAGPDYEVTVCKAVGAYSRAEAEEVMRRIRVSINGGNITAEGPSSGDKDWSVFIIVGAPRGGSLDIETHNGPIDFHGFTGRATARAHNGPINFKDTTGEMRARTQNGPINVSGGGGDFQVDAQNGPIHVRLDGSRWEGKQLEGHTQNGPLTVSVPAGYTSGVRVDTSEHSPVRCVAAQCRDAQRRWDAPSRIQFGSGAPVVRLSTVNGPVTVQSSSLRR